MRRAGWGLLLLAVLAGCGREDAPGPAAPGGAPAPARRIVSLAPNLTEILFALDLGDQVVGVTDYCNYPAAATEKPRVGGFVNPNMEVIVGLEPDLAVATPNVGNRDAVLRMESLGIEFLLVDPDDLAGLYETIRRIAARAGVARRGERLASELEAEVEAVRSQLQGLPPTRTLMIFSHDPLIVAGPGTFFDEILQVAGGHNLATAAGMQFPQFSLEEVVRGAPEALIETTMGSDADAREGFWSRWSTLPAVRDGRICTPPPDVITRPGPRVARGVRLLAECLHPGAIDPDREQGPS